METQDKKPDGSPKQGRLRIKLCERPMESLAVALRMMSPEQRRNVLAPLRERVGGGGAEAGQRGDVGRQGVRDGTACDRQRGNAESHPPERHRVEWTVKAQVALRAAIEAQKARLASLGTSEAFKRPRLRNAGSTANGTAPELVTG